MLLFGINRVLHILIGFVYMKKKNLEQINHGVTSLKQYTL